MVQQLQQEVTGAYKPTPDPFDPHFTDTLFRLRIFTFLVVMITPICVQNLGYKTYVMFAIFNFSFIFLTYFYYPETKGLQLEAVNELFEDTQRWAIGPVNTKKYIDAVKTHVDDSPGYLGTPQDEKSDIMEKASSA